MFTIVISDIDGRPIKKITCNKFPELLYFIDYSKYIVSICDYELPNF